MGILNLKSKNKSQNEEPEFSTSSIKDILDGKKTREWVVRNLGFIIYITILIFFYIGNRYSCEKTIRNIVEIEKELKELRFESITTASELMSLSRMSEVSKMVKEKGLDLEESREPAKKLVVEK
ncbi:FtsL-like putative cell division protein [Saccharicrinis sp. FJH54]|uniref:FtsL-like putative cell division protein n=1 Tax=Saccharicrinis sp. FJH54 TaxID=3344665 RepID=UPI0035D3FB3C